MPAPTQITAAQLARLIGTPAAPTVIDVCLEEDFAAEPQLVPSARHHPFDAVDELVPELAGKPVVIVCQKGRKLSQGAAALLRTRGVRAESLEGGVYGWRDAGLPLIPVASIPGNRAQGHTLWVTRHRPKIDRIACPWLIRRFVDPAARFLFVAPDQVELVAENFGATPFDIEGVEWSHEGEKCTFDVMLDKFALHLPALDTLATIIRGADTDRHDLAPQAAGLLAFSVGLSRMYRDDLEQLEAGMLLYDALYRWARDGQNEGHDWPNPVQAHT